MKVSIDKSVYLKLWQQINPSNDQYINAQKTIQWTQAILNHQKQLLNSPSLKKQSIKLDKSKSLNKKYEAKQEKKSSNKRSSGKNQSQKQVQNEQVAQNQNILNPEESNISSQQISVDLILQYIKKYIETDQYKLIPKPELKLHEPAKQEKQKKPALKSPNRRQTKKQVQKALQVNKYEQCSMSLSYEEAIFFYYWFRKIYEKDQKERFLQKMRKQQESSQNQHQKNKEIQPKETQQIQSQQTSQGANLQKFFGELSQRQKSYLNEESYISLKPHQPKLKIIFKHYVKLSHMLTKQLYTFEERHVLEQMMNLHQWMVFSKEWGILNAKSVNITWEVGRITSQSLMDIYYKNSFFRKQMSFEMFQRAIISVASQMFQDCDIYKFKPIDLMLNFMSIKNEQKYIENLDIKNISYRQSDILSCFKEKERDSYQKMNIIKVTSNQHWRKSKITLLEAKKTGEQQTKLNKKFLKNEGQSDLIEKTTKKARQSMLLRIPQSLIDHQKQELARRYSTVNLSRTSFSNHDRKSAPQIGLMLPTIENNKYFNKITKNNHRNKFKQYIQKQVPESSSVLKNKIMGYHIIHTLQNQQELGKLSYKNKESHQNINKIIGNRLLNMNEGKNQYSIGNQLYFSRDGPANIEKLKVKLKEDRESLKDM